ncbi:MAG: cysteine desulfurase family protein, partial [Promethearchaeota archaeon]
MNKIYMDYGATTPVDPEVIKTMKPFYNIIYGNPSSIHSFGQQASEEIEKSRNHVASILNSNPKEIIFTSSGTESDNLAIKGIALLHEDKKNTKGPHIITTKIEHPAVLETCKFLEKKGFEIAYLPVDKYGLIRSKDLENLITNNTFLCSIIYANNEIGTIQPIDEIGKITKKHGILFHTDAVQAVGKIPIDVKKSHIDLLSLSSHKIYGPKGVGALFLRNGVKITPLFHGGGHEKGLRSSTLNTPGIIGLGKACKLGKQRMSKDNRKMIKQRDTLIKNLSKIEGGFLNGHPTKRLPNNVHYRFTAVEGESLHLMLDDKGIAVATGSACSSKKLEPPHVLLALGLKPEESQG